MSQFKRFRKMEYDETRVDEFLYDIQRLKNKIDIHRAICEYTHPTMTVKCIKEAGMRINPNDIRFFKDKIYNLIEDDNYSYWTIDETGVQHHMKVDEDWFKEYFEVI